MYDFVATWERGTQNCFNAHSMRYLCGCNDGNKNYFGAKSNKQKQWLVWTPRISGFVSSLGSAFIVVDVWKHYRRQGRNKQITKFHELIAAISVFDVISSTIHQ